jgi:hypothetical protein
MKLVTKVQLFHSVRKSFINIYILHLFYIIIFIKGETNEGTFQLVFLFLQNLYNKNKIRALK